MTYDWNTITTDDVIGSFNVSLSEVLQHAEIGKDFLQTYTARMVETGVARARVTIRWNYTVVYRNREGGR